MDDWPGCRPNLNYSTLLTGQIEKRNKHHILYDYMRVTEVHHDMSCFIEFQAVSRKLSSKQIEVRRKKEETAQPANVVRISPLQAVFLNYDSNKDDKLSYEEFKKFMFTNLEEKQKLKEKKL